MTTKHNENVCAWKLSGNARGHNSFESVLDVSSLQTRRSKKGP